MIRYCWLTKELDFSASWSQEDQDEFINDDIKNKAIEKGWRLIKYEVVAGNDFEFPYGCRLINAKALK